MIFLHKVSKDYFKSTTANDLKFINPEHISNWNVNFLLHSQPPEELSIIL